MKIPALAFLLAFGLSQFAFSADNNWPQWRGPNASGSIEAGGSPVKWDAPLWKASLPGKGGSTPIVWNKRIILTAPADGEDAALAFDWDGNPLWQVKLGAGRTGKHRLGTGSNPSAVTDGKSIFVHFKSGNFAALDFDGKILWQTNLVEQFGPVSLWWDYGTSPVLSEKHVIMARMHHGESWVAAFDRATGALVWKTARDFKTANESDNSYTTPLVFRQGGKESLLLWGADHLTAYNAADGEPLWFCGGFNPDNKANRPSVATPVIAGDVAVVCAGRADQNQPRLHGIKLDGTGDVTTNRLWRRDDISSFVPTPVEYKGRVFLLGDRGDVFCIEPATGKTIWSDAFPKSAKKFFASPVIAGGKFYAVREDGVVLVANVSEKFEFIGENALDENSVASPAVAGGRLFIRGERNLFCFAGK